jgi:serine/threonine-protein kinase
MGELGRGGMGKVYKVLDKEIQEEVALKLLNPEIASDERTIERFRNELKYARRITHRNVCRMHDINREKDAYFITMEYVPGGLKTVIKRTGLCLKRRGAHGGKSARLGAHRRRSSRP